MSAPQHPEGRDKSLAVQNIDEMEQMSEKHHGGTFSNSPPLTAEKLQLGTSDRSGDLLVPCPSTSPDDPLNWSWWKKHAVLLSLIPGCLLTDWTLTWGTTVFELQAPEW